MFVKSILRYGGIETTIKVCSFILINSRLPYMSVSFVDVKIHC